MRLNLRAQIPEPWTPDGDGIGIVTELNGRYKNAHQTKIEGGWEVLLQKASLRRYLMQT